MTNKVQIDGIVHKIFEKTGDNWRLRTIILQQAKKVKEKTVWQEFNILAWNEAADAAAELYEGANIYVEGKLESRNFKDKQGNWNTQVQIRLESFCFLDDAPPEQKPPAAKEAKNAAPGNSVEQDKLKELLGEIAREGGVILTQSEKEEIQKRIKGQRALKDKIYEAQCALNLIKEKNKKAEEHFGNSKDFVDDIPF